MQQNVLKLKTKFFANISDHSQMNGLVCADAFDFWWKAIESVKFPEPEPPQTTSVAFFKASFRLLTSTLLLFETVHKT